MKEKKQILNGTNNLDMFCSRICMYFYASVQKDWFTVIDWKSSISTAAAFEIKGRLSNLMIEQLRIRALARLYYYLFGYNFSKLILLLIHNAS